MRTKVIVKGNALIDSRIRRGMSATDLARMVNANHASIVRAEQGRNVTPKLALAICEAVGKTFDDIFEIRCDTERSPKDEG